MVNSSTRGKIFFKVEESEKLIHTIDELGKDEKILKQKPRFIVVTDFEQVLATDTKLKTNKEFPIGELADQVDFFLPLSGAEIYRVSSDNKADRDAAYKLGELYDLLMVDNPDWVAQGSHHLNLFLSRLLFCFFAEDTGIFFVKSIFTETLANNTKAEGSDVDEFLSLLFKKLNTEKEKSKNVVVTHHAPSLKSVSEQYKSHPVTAAYASNMEEFILKHQPDFWIHGHIHTPCCYHIGQTEIICNPHGYIDEPYNGFDKELIIEI